MWMTGDMERNGDGVQRTSACKCPSWSLRNKSWFYRGEGNASLVLAVPKEKIIVRLAKVDTKLKRMDSDYQFMETGKNNAGIRTIQETLERLEFGRRLLAPLLGYRLVSPLNVFHLDVQEIEDIEEKLEASRPAHRLHKKLAPVCHVIVSSDCTLLPYETFSREPVFCVELKPKQGFLSNGRERCPFCLKQFLKQQLGKITTRSEYCPLDLFSGSWPRMLKAVLALTQTPQNNLRIFKNGSLVFGEESPTGLNQVLEDWFYPEDSGEVPDPVCSFAYLLIRALTSPIPNDPDCHITSSLKIKESPHLEIKSSLHLLGCLNGNLSEARRDRSQPCVPPESVLPESCVLQRLLKVQGLGNVDFEELYASYDYLADRMKHERYSYENVRWTNPELTAEWLEKPYANNDESPDSRAVHLVQRYRVYSTARDCSIMIAFQRISESVALLKKQNRPLLFDSRGRLYTYNISIVDVDPKPVTCIDKHRRRDRAMSDAFRASASSHH